MSEEESEAFDRAWEEFKTAIAQEAPFKQILQFARWLVDKIGSAEQ